jgi:hypothetical protein
VAFSAAVATGNWDPCFFRNEFVSSLFMRVHEARLGSDPPRVAPTPVRELAKEDYSWEALRDASDNWREPVIVRGMFSDTEAVAKWPASSVAASMAGVTGNGVDIDGGLSSLAHFNVSVVQNSTMGKDHWINCGGHPNVDAVMEPFGAAFHDIERYDPNSTGAVAKTIVVPPASRSDRVRDPALDDALSKLVDAELDLPRIGGSWFKGIANSALLQLWVGAGDSGSTQGTGLHCDICNNFIVQLAGSKVWEFIHPQYSALLRPTMRRGKTAISGSDITTKFEVLPYIPRLGATIHPGDFMYNPDWYWHTVRNAPGFAMAVVARECNVTNFFQGNPVFSSLILTNHVAAGVFGGDSYALTRLKAALGLVSTMGDFQPAPGMKGSV